MKSEDDLLDELEALAFPPHQIVVVDIDNPEHLDILTDLDIKRSLENPQPGDCLSLWGPTYLLAHTDGTPAGFLTLRPLEDDRIGIDALYVAKEYRGKGYGYALTLVAELAARRFKLPLVALQPLTLSGRKLMGYADVQIADINPGREEYLTKGSKGIWEAYRAETTCKHHHARSRKPACDRCVYKNVYPRIRHTVGLIANQKRAQITLGVVA
ncbi:GNAT family N-acetyltransferase [Streptomyces olivochromogenes]|uniref:GNAT family N-acetyltransferase n=1 Tax=Streptomyces olivochromogenes TaxID=1963 RepID=UPI00099F212C|nr:GNAT family N-acetyltransferase [Streptomyces olivochromogenes]